MTFGELDKALPEKEQESTISPAQERKALELTRKMAETAIEVEGKPIVRDTLLIFDFMHWCYLEDLSPSPELKQIFDDSHKWMEEQRKREVQAGILHSQSLCWMYSEQQVTKIEADPTNEELYGLTTLPHEREKRIKESKQFHDYIRKKESGYFDDLAAGSLREIRGEPPQPLPSPIPPLVKPKTEPPTSELKTREPKAVWSEAMGGFVYV